MPFVSLWQVAATGFNVKAKLRNVAGITLFAELDIVKV
jgi:hypothetical protein